MAYYPEKSSWWQCEDAKDRAEVLESFVTGMIDFQNSNIGFYNLRHARLYSNRYYNLLRGATYGMKKDTRGNNRNQALTENIIRSVVDSVVAKITKKAVRPKVLTDGGDYSQQMLAEEMNRFIAGLMYQTDAHAVMTTVFRDACIFGTGFAKVFTAVNPDGTQKAGLERVMPDEIVIDQADGYYGEPQSLQQIKYVSRKALVEQFPERAADIHQVSATDSSHSYEGSYIDMVRVVEGWALPKNGRKGRHVIEVGGFSLVDEEWTKSYYPFAVIRYSEPLFGYMGTGIAEELTSLQIEINRLLRSVQKSMHLLSSPKIFLQKGSTEPRHMNNEIGTIIEYDSAQPPIVVAPNAVPTGALQQIQLYKQDAYNLAGISQLSAQSQKPAGLDSGAALREFRDSETERFSQTVKAFENLAIDIAELLLKQVREIGDDYQVTAFDRVNGMKVVKWQDIKLDENGYVMQCFPASSLPDTPAGRLAAIQEYLRAGILSADMALELLELPDLDSKVKLQLAPQRLIHQNLDKILSGEDAELPEPTDNLAYAYKTAAQYYALARERDYSEDVQERLRIYMDDVESLLQSMEQQATAQAPVAQVQEQAATQGQLITPEG